MSGTASMQMRAVAALDGLDDLAMTLEVCDTPDLISSLEPEWRALLSRADQAHPGVEPDRYAATIRALQRNVKPNILVLRHGGEATAMVIGRVEQTRLQRRIGYLRLPMPRMTVYRVVYGGVLTRGEAKVEERIADELAQLAASGPYECVITNKLDIASPVMTRLKKSRRTTLSEVRPHWVTDLTPHSFEQTMSRHSSKHRSNLRRLDRKLAAQFDGDIEMRIITSGDEVPMFASAMKSIFECTYKASIARGQMENVNWDETLRSAAASGSLRAYLLIAGGAPIAYQTGALHRGVYYAEGTAYLPEHQSLRPGTVLMMRVMQDLCDQGARLIDWGFGDAEYKRLYGTRFWNEASAQIYGPGWRSSLVRMIDAQVSAVSIIAKRLAGGAMVQRLRRGWRKRAGLAAARQNDDE